MYELPFDIVNIEIKIDTVLQIYRISTTNITKLVSIQCTNNIASTTSYNK